MRFLIAFLLPVLASALLPGSKPNLSTDDTPSKFEPFVGDEASEHVSGSTPSTSSRGCLDQDLSDLVYLRAQLHEVQALISEKKRSISAHNGHYRDTIADCDNLRCVGRVMAKISGSRSHRKPTGRYGYPRKPTCVPSKKCHSSHIPSHKSDSLLPVCRYHAPVSQRLPLSYQPPYHVHSPNRLSGPHRSHSHWCGSRSKSFFTSLGYWFLGVASTFVYLVFRRRSRETNRSTWRADRISAFLARQNEQRNRRAARKAAFKQAIATFLDRFRRRKPSDEYEVDDKQTPLLNNTNERSSATMADDIAEFRSVSDIVSDLVTGKESESQMSSRSRGSITESQNVEEQLPPYTDHNTVDPGSPVSDGLIHTPGSTDYAPLAEDSSDTLGHDKS